MQPKADLIAQLTWTITTKYRKLMIVILLMAIFALSFFAYFKYISMQKELKSLKTFEPIFVLKVNRDLNVGEPIQLTDLSVGKVFREEFESLEQTLPDEKLQRSALFDCRNEFSLSSCQNVIGRVVKTPVYKGSMLRREMLAQEGIEPGIVNLLGKNQAFVDIAVPQTGFNVYLKPNDFVDIYMISRDSSKLIAKKAKIIMIDAMPLGRAPMQVKVDPSMKRNLTLALNKKELYKVTNAVKERKVYVTLHNLKEQEEKPQTKRVSNARPVKRNFFQSLTLIQGNKKEVIKK
jgi:Flp pilus assembly protein CpaB